MSENYRIRVRGHLDDHWSGHLGDLVCERKPDGSTELVGPLVDQAALHGVLERIRDLGLILLSVDQATPTSDATETPDPNDHVK